MLRKRIIFSLIYEDGKFTQSRNFRLQKVGDINWLEKNYKFRDIAFSLDELIVLNASRENKNISEFAKTLERLVDSVFIPISAGGGIRSIEDARILFENGADKLVLNSILHLKPEVVEDIVQQYGSQSVVACVDYKKNGNEIKLYIEDGKTKIPLRLEEYIKHLENLKVGEIYLNSIEKDGTGFGYDFEVIDEVSKYMKIPLIIAGGAGNENHLIDGLKREKVDAVATANLFNFVGDGLVKARERIISKGLI